jgi:uncharacterized protein involved in exopolysaccharide biosynthesis
MNEEINIMDYVKVIIKWKQFIACFTAAVVILTVLISLFMPWTYKAKTTILLPQQGGKGLEGIMALTSMMTGTTINMPADLSRSLIGRTINFSDILKSNTIAEMIAENLHLGKYYRSRSKEKLTAMIKNKLKIKEQKGILTISAEDRSPRLAADLANYAVLALDEFNKRGNMQYARRLKNFLRDQLVTAKVDLSDAEENLKKFETQSQMVKISQRELMLARYMRDVKVKEALYTMLLQEYEKAKIEEAKEELFFEVLDPAKPPKSPSTPKPFLYSTIALFLGLFSSVFLAFFFEYMETLGVQIPQFDYNKELEWLKTRKF